MKSSSRRQVYVVDGDPAALQAVQELLEGEQYAVSCYPTATAFLADLPNDAEGCVITDYALADMSGHELQRRLRASHPLLSVIVLSRQMDVSSAVQVMEEGAITVIQMPFSPPLLREAVRKGFAKSDATAKGFAEVAVIRHRLATLAPEERRVLKYMIAGVPNKRIVAELQLSPRTVDRRRAAVLAKMQVESVPALAGLLSRVGDWE